MDQSFTDLKQCEDKIKKIQLQLNDNSKPNRFQTRLETHFQKFQEKSDTLHIIKTYIETNIEHIQMVPCDEKTHNLSTRIQNSKITAITKRKTLNEVLQKERKALFQKQGIHLSEL